MNSHNKYPEGTIVYALVAPTLKLKVRRFVDRIYYCQHADHVIASDLVYFERELTNKAG